MTTGDPLKGIKIELGGKVRTLKFTFRAMRIAQQKFNGRAIRDIVQGLDVDQVVELTAAALFHEDRTISAQQVEAWLEAQPRKFVELSQAVVQAVTEAYRRMTPEDEETKPAGESLPSGTDAATTAAGPTGG